MQDWEIALIVIGSVIGFLLIAFAIGSIVAFRLILGRRGAYQKAGETAEKYGVDLAWMEKMRDKTETVEMVARDGVKLRALLLKHDSKPLKVALCHHGYWATPHSVQPYAKLFYDMGFDVLMPAARAHSISDGKCVGMAWLDRFDVVRWVDRLIALYGENVQIALMGVSMGGASVIAASGMGLPPQVKCVIDDCGFNSQRDEYYACLAQARLHLPKALLLSPLSVAVRLRCGYSIGKANIEPLARKMTIPALFFHGEEDTFVPCELGRKLFEACGSAEKEFIAVPGAAHACAYVADKENYSRRFCEFVERHIN